LTNLLVEKATFDLQNIITNLKFKKQTLERILITFYGMLQVVLRAEICYAIRRNAN